jgi:hypothetical protein
MCPDRDILSAYIDREIGVPWDEAIAAHAASCARCRAILDGLIETRHALHGEGEPDWKGPMERVRRGILAHAAAQPATSPLWRRKVPVPMPLAALAAAVVLCLGVALVAVLLRSNVGLVRITKAPAGGTEIQIAAPIGNLEALIRSIGGEDPSKEDIIILPKNVRLVPVGEPRMGKADEFPRKKSW